MAALNDWDVTDANNNAAPPDGWPENTMAYSDVNDTGRAVQGTLKRYFADNNGSLVGGGVADAYTVTLNETGYTSYFTGLTFACSIPANNTGATTFNVNSIGAVNVVQKDGSALLANTLESGGVYSFSYDGTNLQILGGGGGLAAGGGSDTQLQYNDGGILGGMAGTAWNDADDTLGWTADNTTEDLINIDNDSSLTSGTLLRLRQNNFSFSNAILEVIQDNGSVGGVVPSAILVQNDSASGLTINTSVGRCATFNLSSSGGTAVQVTHNGSNGAGVTVDAAHPAITAFVGISNEASRTQPLVEYSITNSTGSGDILFIDNDQSGYGIQITCQAGSDAIDVQAGTIAMRAFNEFRQFFTGGAGTKNLDTELGTIFVASSSMSGAITFTFDNPAINGFATTITLFLNDADNATITWPASVDWANGAEPAWSTGIDIVSFVTHDGGTTWYGFLGGLDFS